MTEHDAGMTKFSSEETSYMRLNTSPDVTIARS
jgi:hypothetical protein